MAAIKMTFSLPAELARKFMRLVPARERSRYLAAALEASLTRKNEELIRACKLANADPEIARIERELDAIEDRVEGSWDDAPQR